MAAAAVVVVAAVVMAEVVVAMAVVVVTVPDPAPIPIRMHMPMLTKEQRLAVENDSTSKHVYPDASFSISTVEQLVLVHGLPSLWLLLDRCSTADTFANSDLLNDIHDVPTPIWVCCNAGRIKLTKHGYFGWELPIPRVVQEP